MIKQLKKQDVQTTPFIATKDWNLLNVQHQDLVLLEVNSEIPAGDDTFIALEFVDYSFGSPDGILNTECNISLEQQDYDPVIYEEGISGSGLFYPSDPQNLTGTYKRLVYQQILRAFYNNYHNPLKIFGSEQLDFQTSGTQKYLSNYFRIFTLPQQNFGDRISKGSVTFVDNTFDDNYTVTDDSQGNLLAWPNLFSRVQEIRDVNNVYVRGTADYVCPDPIVSFPDAPILAAIAINYSSSYLWWSGSTQASGYYIWRSDDFGSSWFYIGSTISSITESFDFGLQQTSSYSYKISAFNTIGSSSWSNTASIVTPESSSVSFEFLLGPYDTFEEYTSGSNLIGATGGAGWIGPWVVSNIAAYTAVSYDNIDDYTVNSDLSGSGFGLGWNGNWSSFEGT